MLLRTVRAVCWCWVGFCQQGLTSKARPAQERSRALPRMGAPWWLCSMDAAPVGILFQELCSCSGVCAVPRRGQQGHSLCQTLCSCFGVCGGACQLCLLALCSPVSPAESLGSCTELSPGAPMRRFIHCQLD